MTGHMARDSPLQGLRTKSRLQKNELKDSVLYLEEEKKKC
jgi:hypothetical protein